MHDSKLTTLAAAAALFAIAGRAVASDLIVTEWRGLAAPGSDPPAFAAEAGDGDWFADAVYSATPPPDQRSPWTRATPATVGPSAAYDVVIGASRVGAAPTRSHVVTLFSPAFGSAFNGDVPIDGLRVGTDYVLRVQNYTAPDATAQRRLRLAAGSVVRNDGVVQLMGSATANTVLQLIGPTDLVGTGTYELGDPQVLASQLHGGIGTIAAVVTGGTAGPASTFTVGAGITIRGFGTTSGLTRNDGTILADVAPPASTGVGANLQVSVNADGTAQAPGLAVNNGTMRATNGAQVTVNLLPTASFRNSGTIEAIGKGSRILLAKGRPMPNAFSFDEGHKFRAVDGGTVEARGWTISSSQIEVVGTGNTLAVGTDGTFDNGGKTLALGGALSLELSDKGTFAGGRIDAASASAFVVPAGSVATLRDASVNGTVSIDPTSTLALAGTVSGSFTADGDVAVGGTLSPGNSPGTVHVAGDLRVAAGGGWRIETGGDLVVVDGLLDLSAANDLLTLVGGTVGQTYTIAQFGTLSGTFDQIAGDAPAYALSVDGHALNVTLLPEPTALAAAAGVGALALRRRRRGS